MESVSRSIDENVVRSAAPGQSAEVIWLEPRARLADRITRGAAAMAASPAETLAAGPVIASSSSDDAASELPAAKVSEGPIDAAMTPQNDEPTVSADRIVTLIREQQELIGRILQNQNVPGAAPASTDAGEIVTEMSEWATPTDQPFALSIDPVQQLPPAQDALPSHRQLMRSETPQTEPIDNDRPPMIIERAQASQGMQLIGDLAAPVGRPRPSWPGFIAGVALAFVLGAVLYAKLGPSV